MDNEYEVKQIDVEPMQVCAVEQVAIDKQISTAKAYPRDLIKVKNNVLLLVTMDRDTAESCSYALPRKGKPITGPSVHLARIIAQQYGNLRAETKVVEITDKHVVSRGTAWDLESNYAVSFEVNRSIIGKYGRYNDDMITVTGNAANAIAFRNAVFSVVPKNITDAALNAAQNLITGDLSDKKKLEERRAKAIKYFKDEYGITEPEILKMLGKHKVDQLGAEQIRIMLSTSQALEDGDTTVDELMKDIRKPAVQEKKEILKNKKGGTTAPNLF
ncbi:MAG: hypothetical protein PHS04_09880 [Tissierellia bacterium]|nr:hypothetical protein [Tissierellia bacterium]